MGFALLVARQGMPHVIAEAGAAGLSVSAKPATARSGRSSTAPPGLKRNVSRSRSLET